MRTFSPRETKTNILAAYRELEKEHELLQEKLAKFEPTEVTENGAPDSDISRVAMAFQGLQGNLRNAVGGYQNAVANELLKLQALRLELDVEENRLKDLHSITLNGGSTLPTLVCKYEQQVETNWEARKNAAREHQELVMQRRERWEQEQIERDEYVAQRDAAYAVSATRDEEQYAYNTAQKKALHVDNDVQADKQFDTELALIKTTQQKQWQERENAIAARELVCNNLRNELAKLVVDIEREIKAAQGQGEGIAKGKAAMDARMAKTAHNAAISELNIIFESHRRTQHETVARIEALQEQLSVITDNNLQLSQSALNSAEHGSEKALEAVSKIAIAQTQAPTGKR